MLIQTRDEIIKLMPTARWDKPEQLFGYLEEEERVALEPLLGHELFSWLCQEYERLRPTEQGQSQPDVTQRLEALNNGNLGSESQEEPQGPSAEDIPTLQLIRICQQIIFYKMLAHKAGLLTVSFNEGGGMNTVSADGYEPADEKRLDRLAKDAFMSAGRSIDTLLLFLEDDAKGDRHFADKWASADTFYLHTDLLFSTARELNEYLDINGERSVYVSLVRDIRYCQRTYIERSIGRKTLAFVLGYLKDGTLPEGVDEEVVRQSADLLRSALAFFVEGRRAEVGGKKLARQDSILDARQALAEAVEYIKENLQQEPQEEAAPEPAPAPEKPRKRRAEFVFRSFPAVGSWNTESSKK